ncbi:hypothetical protein CLU79DRAFT_764935 [Phycomyces nitens]|nr:hypothetical protein CLU79DRAFT_764935 [Phycomyces nitens]
MLDPSTEHKSWADIMDEEMAEEDAAIKASYVPTHEPPKPVFTPIKIELPSRPENEDKPATIDMSSGTSASRWATKPAEKTTEIPKEEPKAWSRNLDSPWRQRLARAAQPPVRAAPAVKPEDEAKASSTYTAASWHMYAAAGSPIFTNDEDKKEFVQTLAGTTKAAMEAKSPLNPQVPVPGTKVYEEAWPTLGAPKPSVAKNSGPDTCTNWRKKGSTTTTALPNKESAIMTNQPIKSEPKEASQEQAKCLLKDEQEQLDDSSLAATPPTNPESTLPYSQPKTPLNNSECSDEAELPIHTEAIDGQHTQSEPLEIQSEVDQSSATKDDSCEPVSDQAVNWDTVFISQQTVRDVQDPAFTAQTWSQTSNRSDVSSANALPVPSNETVPKEVAPASPIGVPEPSCVTPVVKGISSWQAFAAVVPASAHESPDAIPAIKQDNTSKWQDLAAANVRQDTSSNSNNTPLASDQDLAESVNKWNDYCKKNLSEIVSPEVTQDTKSTEPNLDEKVSNSIEISATSYTLEEPLQETTPNDDGDACPSIKIQWKELIGEATERSVSGGSEQSTSWGPNPNSDTGASQWKSFATEVQDKPRWGANQHRPSMSPKESGVPEHQHPDHGSDFPEKKVSSGGVQDTGSVVDGASRWQAFASVNPRPSTWKSGVPDLHAHHKHGAAFGGHHDRGHHSNAGHDDNHGRTRHDNHNSWQPNHNSQWDKPADANERTHMWEAESGPWANATQVNPPVQDTHNAAQACLSNDKIGAHTDTISSATNQYEKKHGTGNLPGHETFRSSKASLLSSSFESSSTKHSADVGVNRWNMYAISHKSQAPTPIENNHHSGSTGVEINQSWTQTHEEKGSLEANVADPPFAASPGETNVGWSNTNTASNVEYHGSSFGDQAHLERHPTDPRLEMAAPAWQQQVRPRRSPRPANREESRPMRSY